jgi:hypothetical protein
MIHLRTVHSAFHARVIAARLGADGIPTQLRGAVDGPYPIGDVSIWVNEEDADCARELLLADEVESAFDTLDQPEAGESLSPGRRPFLLGLTRSQLLALLGIVVVLCGGVVARALV